MLFVVSVIRDAFCIKHVIAMTAKMSAAITVSYCVALRSDEAQPERWQLTAGVDKRKKYTFLFTLVTDCLPQSVFVLYNSVFIVTVTPKLCILFLMKI